MTTITIRDKQIADEQDSPYLVLVGTGTTSYAAYKTIAEFMHEWHDSLQDMRLNSRSFAGQKALFLTCDWTVNTIYEYTEGIKAAVANGARACDLLSNGSVRPGAILVDAVNRQTTFLRLNPNDKNY